MRWLKGVVLKRVGNLFLIELENGRREWTTPYFKPEIREHVLISWDYTNDCIGTITTKERVESTETIRDKVERSMWEVIVDVFRIPMNEGLDGDVSDITEIASKHELNTEEENSMVDVFQVPLGEDVDSDDIVLLRDDITNH